MRRSQSPFRRIRSRGAPSHRVRAGSSCSTQVLQEGREVRNVVPDGGVRERAGGAQGALVLIGDERSALSGPGWCVVGLVHDDYASRRRLPVPPRAEAPLPERSWCSSPARRAPITIRPSHSGHGWGAAAGSRGSCRWGSWSSRRRAASAAAFHEAAAAAWAGHAGVPGRVLGEPLYVLAVRVSGAGPGTARNARASAPSVSRRCRRFSTLSSSATARRSHPESSALGRSLLFLQSG